MHCVIVMSLKKKYMSLVIEKTVSILKLDINIFTQCIELSFSVGDLFVSV